jgi:integrase
MLPTRDDIGVAITPEEEDALLYACRQSRARCLYVAVVLALNTGMRYSEIRLLKWKQLDFSARILTVGKSKSPNGTGRAISLNPRVLNVLKMWATQFPERLSTHYVFALEKYGAKGAEGSFGFTASVVTYDTDPTRPIGDWKEAWEKAKKRAGAILSGRAEDEDSEPLVCRFHDLRHTAVTRLLEAGVPYPVVASMMGWSAATAIRMSKRYGHIGSKALREAANVLGRVRTPTESLKKSPKSLEAATVVVQ